jgi:hypothetical protein
MKVNIIDHNRNVIGHTEPTLELQTRDGKITEINEDSFVVICELGLKTTFTKDRVRIPEAYYINLNDDEVDNVITTKPVSSATKAVRLMSNSTISEYRDVILALSKMATSTINRNNHTEEPAKALSKLSTPTDEAELVIIRQLLNNK